MREEGSIIGVGQLPDAIRSPSRDTVGGSVQDGSFHIDGPLRPIVEVDRLYLMHAIGRCAGNKRLAARSIHMSPSKMYDLLRGGGGTQGYRARRLANEPGK